MRDIMRPAECIVFEGFRVITIEAKLLHNLFKADSVM